MVNDYQLWLGDCLEEMDRIESGSVDAIIADWPYQKTNCHWDSMIPLEPLWKQCKRVIKSKGVIVLTASQPFTSLLVMSNLKWFKWEDVWDKRSPVGHLNCKVLPLRRHENIIVFGRGRITYNPQMRTGVLKRKGGYGHLDRRSVYGVHGNNKPTSINDQYYPTSIIEMPGVNVNLHPTQKPLSLMEYLVRTFTNEGDTILDNTCGSGSTLEAAMRCNRRSIGIEKDAGYFDIASQRLERVTAELRGELTHLPMFQEAIAV